MSILDLIAIAGTTASLAALVYAVVTTRQSRRRRELAYHITPAMPLASVLPDTAGHRLSIIYERAPGQPENVRGAFLRFVQVANLGKEAVRREDVAKTDPLRLYVGGNVLDVAIAAVSRPVVNAALGQPTAADEGVETALGFDFLDSQDGMSIRVLTEVPDPAIVLRGTVIGMPGGISQRDVFDVPWLGTAFVSLLVVLECVAVATAFYIFWTVTGGWTRVWLFAVPLVAVLLPVFVAGGLAILLDRPKHGRLDAVKPPKWFRPPLDYERMAAKIIPGAKGELPRQ